MKRLTIRLSFRRRRGGGREGEKEISMLEKIQSGAIKAQRAVFIVAMAFMLVVLAVNVFMRYVFGKPLIWSEEVTSLVQGGIAFLGIGYCFARNKHTELTMVYDRLPARLRALCDIVTNSVMLYCLYKLIGVALRLVSRQMIPLGTVSWLKLGYFHVMIPLGLIIACVYVFAALLMALRRFLGPAAATAGTETGED